MLRIIIFIFTLFFTLHSQAAVHTVNLDVAYHNVNYTGVWRPAITVNQQIPAPTLHFRQGDRVVINVRNHLDQETAIHWHGLLVPWQMDGVKGVTQHGIKPGETFRYEFTLMQSGTYWYHAHAGLQEQQGLYGALLIDPPKKPSYHYNKDMVVVLSDWTNTNPDQVLANLKKDGDYYSQRFPLQPSLMRFIHDYRKAGAIERQYLLSDYKMMQQMRMGIYDFSDVAYSAFLMNGKTNLQPWTAQVKPGDVVRLRFIGAGASTIFRVKIPNHDLQVVHLQGNDVVPVTVKEFSIAPGETYDVLVKVGKQSAVIYAESLDTSGAVIGVLATSQPANTNVSPFPTPQPVTRTMMETMMGDDFQASSSSMSDMNNMSDMPGMSHHMDMGDDMKMDHHETSHHPMSMDMPVEPSIIGDKLTKPSSSYRTSTGIKYEDIKAAVKTNDPNKPIADVINMELFGYMNSYIWFINGVPEEKAKPIVLQPGKRYRFVFTNTSMMRHPMHLHGHWFILRKGDGEYDPLLHTIDVPPGATITADVDTDASGQWIFHCHLLYHMMSGMTRIFQYSTLLELTQGEVKPQNIVKNTAYENRPIVRVDEVRPISDMLVKHPMPHLHGIWLASFVDVGVSPFENLQKISFKGLYGPDYNKLELFANDMEIENGSISEADLDIFYWHQLYQFWAVKGGLNYFYRPAAAPYFQPGIGVEGLLPYFIDVDLRGYLHEGIGKLDIDVMRDTQITNNLFIRLELRGTFASQTNTAIGIASGLNEMRYTLRPYYRLMPGLSVFAEYEYDQMPNRYRNVLIANNSPTDVNAFTVGLSVVL